MEQIINRIINHHTFLFLDESAAQVLVVSLSLCLAKLGFFLVTSIILGPCWVENQSSVTNDGKDINEEIIDIIAAPEIF